MRHFFSFFKSRTFLIQLALAVLVLVGLSVAILQGLKHTTHHGTFVVVPDFSKMSVAEMREAVAAARLRYQVLDSSDYNPAYPRFSILEQNPPAGNKVKANRKIYFTVNPSGYKKVTVPNVIQVTQRNATAMLRAVGLEVRRTIYINELGKDMVYRMKHRGQYVQPGDKLPKTSKIDLICGNGATPRSYHTQADSL